MQMAVKCKTVESLSVDVMADVRSAMMKFCLAAYERFVEDVTPASKEAIQVRLNGADGMESDACVHRCCCC